jgi:hypothetical protein
MQGGRYSIPYFVNPKLNYVIQGPEKRWGPVTGFDMLSKTGRHESCMHLWACEEEYGVWMSHVSLQPSGNNAICSQVMFSSPAAHLQDQWILSKGDTA